MTPEFTREQFDKVMEELWHFPKETWLDNDAVWEVVQECIKEVQE